MNRLLLGREHQHEELREGITMSLKLWVPQQPQDSQSFRSSFLAGKASGFCLLYWIHRFTLRRSNPAACYRLCRILNCCGYVIDYFQTLRRRLIARRFPVNRQ